MPFETISGPSMFDVFPFVFTIIFLLAFGIIAFGIIKGIGQWQYNNSQPVLSVLAKIVAKRTNVSRSGSMHHHNSDGFGHHHHGHTSTTYYITFEVESGDRMEFHVKDKEYGLLAEGDIGKLTFQGTRYLGFERKSKTSKGE